jgi:hypothetical protein
MGKSNKYTEKSRMKDRREEKTQRVREEEKINV